MDNTSVRHTAHLGYTQTDVCAWVETGRIQIKFDVVPPFTLEMGESDCEDLIAVLRAALADKES